MRTSISCKKLLAVFAATCLIAGCASVPAPVANHSFGPGEASTAPATTAQPANANSNGVQTFGLGHANGTTSAAGYTVAPGDTLYSIAFAHGMDFRALAALNNLPPPYVIHPGQVLKLKASQSMQASNTIATATVPTTPVPAAASSAPEPPAAPVFGPVTTQTLTGNGVAAAAPATSTAVASAPAVSTSASIVPAATAAPPTAMPGTQPEVAATPTPPSGATRNVAGVTWQWPASGKLISGFQDGSGGDGAGIDIAGQMGDPVRAAASGTVVYSGNGLPGYGALIIIKHNDTYLSAYGHNSKRLVKEGDHVSAGQEIALMGASGAPRVELHFEIRKDGKPVDPMSYLPKR